MSQEFLHEYKVKADPSSGLVLIKDEIQVFCHKLMPMPMSGNLGQTQFFRFPCGTNCGKANIVKDGDGNKFVQSCDGTINEFPLVDESVTNNTISDAKILSIS